MPLPRERRREGVPTPTRAEGDRQRHQADDDALDFLFSRSRLLRPARYHAGWMHKKSFLGGFSIQDRHVDGEDRKRIPVENEGGRRVDREDFSFPSEWKAHHIHGT